MEFFIEGGRSRSGKMLNPKLGFLSAICEAAADIAMNAKNYPNSESCKTILLVPISINYERVLESSSFAQERLGIPPQSEKQKAKTGKLSDTLHSLLAIFDTFSSESLGDVYIRFGKPISVQDAVSTRISSYASVAQSLSNLSIAKAVVGAPTSTVNNPNSAINSPPNPDTTPHSTPPLSPKLTAAAATTATAAAATTKQTNLHYQEFQTD